MKLFVFLVFFTLVVFAASWCPPSHPVVVNEDPNYCRTADGRSLPNSIIHEDPKTGLWYSTFSTNDLVIATPRPDFFKREKRAESWNSAHKGLSNTYIDVRGRDGQASEDNSNCPQGFVSTPTGMIRARDGLCYTACWNNDSANPQYKMYNWSQGTWYDVPANDTPCP